MTKTAQTLAPQTPASKLSPLDRYLGVWILAAIAVGLGLGKLIPELSKTLESFNVAGISVPVALGLLVMMYPVLAKVRYKETERVLSDKKLMLTSLLINWLLAPAFMFVLAWVFLADLPEYRTGLIIVGLARCIAMVFIWNDLAFGDREAAAVLVAINSVFQVFAFSALGWFYLQWLPSLLGLPTTSAEFSFWVISASVLVFLGLPLVAGLLTRTIGEKVKGRDWYESNFLPKIGPWALYGLLFTIVILFALQGNAIVSNTWDVARIALPLIVYFVATFSVSMLIGHALNLGYERTTSLAFTAASNNFELAIAVTITTFGITSGQALAGVVGPLIEVPLLIFLVYVALWSRKFFAEQKTNKPSVLFVCTHNAGRSQMAAAFLSKLSRGAIEVRSAGSTPAEHINPAALTVMNEVGIDLSAEMPKILTIEAVQESDVIITMGCGDTCPIFPGKRYEDWQLDDPAGQTVETVRRIRDEISDRISKLVTDLLESDHALE